MTSLSRYWQLLAEHIRPQMRRFTILMALMVVSMVLQVINPQIMRYFIDTALGSGPLRDLTLAAVAFISIAIIQQGMAVSVTYLDESVAWTATNALRADLARHCLSLPMSFHNQHTPGEMIERIDGDVTELAAFFSQFAVVLIGNSLLIIGILVAIYIIYWPAGLGFTLFCAMVLAILIRVRNLAVKEQKSRRQAEAELYGFLEEQLASTEDIRSSGAVSFSLRELFRFQGNSYRTNRKASRKGWWIHGITFTLVLVGNLLAIGSGYFLFRLGMITVGTVYLFISYVNQIEQPLSNMARQLDAFQTIGACVERLTELKQLKPEGDGMTAIQNRLSPGPLSLSFEDVSFSYNAEDATLSHLSFSIQPGKVLGLLGRTGSGKTTLTRLVFRLYEPEHGHILLAGKDTNGYSLPDLRQQVGMITQEVQLFQSTVRDNLAFFDRSIPDPQIISVLEELELGDWLRSLPQGLDTQLQAGGRSLSAGEAQLLAVARIFLRQPGLVILDEASSRLDPATEQRIERAIDRLLHDRSAIIIAHRLETVQRADDILILEDGKILEAGSRLTLAADPTSHYAALLETGMQELLV